VPAYPGCPRKRLLNGYNSSSNSYFFQCSFSALTLLVTEFMKLLVRQWEECQACKNTGVNKAVSRKFSSITGAQTEPTGQLADRVSHEIWLLKWMWWWRWWSIARELLWVGWWDHKSIPERNLCSCFSICIHNINTIEQQM